MRRIAEMDELIRKILKVRVQAQKDGETEIQMYCPGVFQTLLWVKDKKGEDSLVWGHNDGTRENFYRDFKKYNKLNDNKKSE